MKLIFRIGIRNKLWEISFHAGWYSGELFKLFALSLFEDDCCGGAIIFMLQIAKFSFYISADKVE